MPVQHHDQIEFVAGDDWDIGGTLLRPDGTAFDLTEATVIWMLRGPDGVPVLQADQYTVKLNSPLTAGLITIVVPAAVTATLPPGPYLDWLRATDNAGTDVFWTGMIIVDANPYAEPDPPPALPIAGDPTFVLPQWWWQQLINRGWW